MFGIDYVVVTLVVMGVVAIGAGAVAQRTRRQYESIGRAMEEATGGGGYYGSSTWGRPSSSSAAEDVGERLQEMGENWKRGFQGLGQQLRAVPGKVARSGAAAKVVGAAKGAFSWVKKRLPHRLPQVFLAAGRADRFLMVTGGMMLAAGIGLGAASIPQHVGKGAAGGGGAADLEGLARAWFTFNGDVGAWTDGLGPYLVPGAAGPLRECIGKHMGPLVWRLAGTRIVDGPWVEVQGRLADLEYGLAGRGGAVGHPGIRERYGVELGPDDIGVRIAAVVARELPPEKAALPGTDIITRPQKVTAQLFVMKDGRAVPDETECGRGVVFVG